jgi:low affinity Fe/Cu permease
MQWLGTDTRMRRIRELPPKRQAASPQHGRMREYNDMKRLFRDFAQRIAEIVGSPWAFFSAVLVTLVWGLTGPHFRYSDTWQLVINTGTTIITFLMVFLIQSTQNRDSKALHLKLDELIRAVGSARNTLVNLENCTDEELASLEEEFKKLRQRAQRKKSPPHE